MSATRSLPLRSGDLGLPVARGVACSTKRLTTFWPWAAAAAAPPDEDEDEDEDEDWFINLKRCWPTPTQAMFLVRQREHGCPGCVLSH